MYLPFKYLVAKCDNDYPSREGRVGASIHHINLKQLFVSTKGKK